MAAGRCILAAAPGPVVIVTDALAEQRGAVEEVRRRLGGAAVQVFAGIPVEPDEAAVRTGVEALDRSAPDVLIALGVRRAQRGAVARPSPRL